MLYPYKVSFVVVVVVVVAAVVLLIAKTPWLLVIVALITISLMVGGFRSLLALRLVFTSDGVGVGVGVRHNQ